MRSEVLVMTSVMPQFHMFSPVSNYRLRVSTQGSGQFYLLNSLTIPLCFIYTLLLFKNYQTTRASEGQNSNFNYLLGFSITSEVCRVYWKTWEFLCQFNNSNSRFSRMYGNLFIFGIFEAISHKAIQYKETCQQVFECRDVRIFKQNNAPFNIET